MLSCGFFESEYKKKEEKKRFYSTSLSAKFINILEIFQQTKATLPDDPAFAVEIYLHASPAVEGVCCACKRDKEAETKSTG